MLQIKPLFAPSNCHGKPRSRRLVLGWARYSLITKCFLERSDVCCLSKVCSVDMIVLLGAALEDLYISEHLSNEGRTSEESLCKYHKLYSERSRTAMIKSRPKGKLCQGRLRKAHLSFADWCPEKVRQTVHILSSHLTHRITSNFSCRFNTRAFL